ncbi:MAG: amidohydrolase [Acidobacteria bacterium]|nr:amidohydrolase [Acidobacteriota bacterium]
MTHSRRVVITITCLIVGALAMRGPAAGQPPDAGAPADTIFAGDHIVTMEPGRPAVEAVAVRGETIVAAGARDDVMALRGDATRVVELGQRALLPGFIDTHGHFLAVGMTLDALALHPPPVGDVRTIDDIVRKIRAWIAERDIPPGEMVSGGGYDDSLLAENRHPTRFDLDRASTEHPIVLTHVSGHLRTANSLALRAAGVTGDTPDPPGGHIRRIAGTGEPDGVLEETAGGLVGSSWLFRPTDDLEGLARRAIDVYTSYGTTTIQDGATGQDMVRQLRAAAEREPFAADVAVFPRFRTLEDAERATLDADYRGGLRVAGVKFSLDGSPQGRTAWVTEPYHEGPPGAPADYRAYGTLDPELYRAGAAHLIRRGVPIIVHANGDAAIDLMLGGVEAAVAGIDPPPDHRAVIIHAQLMRADQLDRAAVLGAVPSFFSAHAFFWGDWHRRSFGEARGNAISPVRWAIERGVRFTVHNDAPVVPPDIMRLVSITVNRRTRSGHVLGPEQRATVREALHAVTLGAAYQYFEEDVKGSIAPGKQADLVVLETNPLTADPAELEHIRVVETFSRGRSVYAQPAE